MNLVSHQATAFVLFSLLVLSHHCSSYTNARAVGCIRKRGSYNRVEKRNKGKGVGEGWREKERGRGKGWRGEERDD